MLFCYFNLRDKLENIQSKIKRKKLKKYPRTHYLRKRFLRNLINAFFFLYSNLILMHSVILNFQTLKFFKPLLQSVWAVVFLEIVVLLKLARTSLQFVKLPSLRGEIIRYLVVLRLLLILKKAWQR